jgi:copper transport protein
MIDDVTGSFRHELEAQRGLSSSRLAFGVVLFLMSLTAKPAPAASDSDSFFTHLHTEKAMANVTISPGRAGPVDITIQLETVDELPLTARAVSVTLRDAQSEGDRQTLQATRGGDDQWHVRTSMKEPGRWILGLGISISETDSVNIESPILIK